MKKNIKGKTVRVILNQRADAQAVNQYGDIWKVMSFGEETAMLTLNETIWTPQVTDIKEVEFEEGGTYPLKNLRIKHKYRSFNFI